jgi:hypothetical protein
MYEDSLVTTDVLDGGAHRATVEYATAVDLVVVG